MNKTKKDRANTVNDIIKAIGNCGREFFKHEGELAKVIVKNNRVYMINEYNKAVMPIRTRHGYEPKMWTHGGTLWGLTKDFGEFVDTGKTSNGRNGYGGLYCSHWGYDELEMEAIRRLARVLGYLQ